MQMNSSAFDRGGRVVARFSPIRPGAGVRRGLLSAALVLAAVSASPGSAQDAVAQFYRGRQITVIVGSSAGGGRGLPGRPAFAARLVKARLTWRSEDKQFDEPAISLPLVAASGDGSRATRTPG